ncbi:MAG: isoaspartyl peptidase/L-asparaginase [Bacteroidia bacterium]
MTHTPIVVLLLGLPLSLGLWACLAQDGQPTYALAIHGGAGTISREHLSPEQEAQYRASLEAALDTGAAILQAGGTALDAVEAVVRLLEDDSLFNAGRGAVLTHDETAELDASLMDGATRAAGAVAGVRTVRHPISAARKVMEASPHVLLAREGAEAFAQAQGLEMVDNSYFITQARLAQLRRIKARSTGALVAPPEGRHGTVGAVALDQHGNLAAATSTGGMADKRYGRIGDSPLIGAGTYADNQTCAVSCTGHGEFFIRYAVAYDVSARMAYLGEPLETAAAQVVEQTLAAAGGEGGLIAVDRQGHIAMPFNTSGMYRACTDSRGRREVAIFK